MTGGSSCYFIQGHNLAICHLEMDEADWVFIDKVRSSSVDRMFDMRNQRLLKYEPAVRWLRPVLEEYFQMRDLSWSDEDQQNALREGWGLFHVDDVYPEIQKFDEACVFESDASAVAHIMGAVKFSDDCPEYYRKAWAIHSLFAAHSLNRNPIQV
jgi:hypothetical protein